MNIKNGRISVGTVAIVVFQSIDSMYVTLQYKWACLYFCPLNQYFVAKSKAKYDRYLNIINKSGGNFIPLVCESFGVCMSTLFTVVDRSTVKRIYSVSLPDDNYCSNFLSPCGIIILR